VFGYAHRPATDATAAAAGIVRKLANGHYRLAEFAARLRLHHIAHPFMQRGGEAAVEFGRGPQAGDAQRSHQHRRGNAAALRAADGGDGRGVSFGFRYTARK